MNKSGETFTKVVITFLTLSVGWLLGYLHCWMAFK